MRGEKQQPDRRDVLGSGLVGLAWTALGLPLALGQEQQPEGAAPSAAQASGYTLGSAALEGIHPDTIFVPTTLGLAQRMCDELGLPPYESINHLTDNRYFDNPSGQHAYKCFACRVRKA